MSARNVKLAVQGVSRRSACAAFGARTTRCSIAAAAVVDVYEGEVVSLIGESGCGKTTLLRIIQGLSRRDAGTILVDGKPVTGPGRDRGYGSSRQTSAVALGAR